MGVGGLTSGCGAGLQRTVDLSPTEACADLARLVGWDPGFQELKENKAQGGPMPPGTQSLGGHGGQAPHLWLGLPSGDTNPNPGLHQSHIQAEHIQAESSVRL